ncbi:MAG: hypothetical protein L0G27_12000 [Paracoccus sp. (in: a-proteobacteria)]|nr:hypothetical protein [Paracoccus sp. (in: a-proteobacteria)]
MELSTAKAPEWTPPKPRRAATHTACSEDWFTRNGSQPDPRPEDEALITALILRAFGS